MATVLILLDAFRRDYLAEHNTPFLWSCSREGEHYKGVIQSFGFCERSEILTGMNGRESGFLTAIGFDPDASPYRGNKLLHLFPHAANRAPASEFFPLQSAVKRCSR
jgi:predicted AlkP superfamily pyrophosphatase or phosphodiesterase